MFCTKCGKEIPDGSQFCTFCGNKTFTSNPVANNENTIAGNIQKTPVNQASRQHYEEKSNGSNTAVILAIVLVAVCAIGGFFYYRQTKIDAARTFQANKTRQVQTQQVPKQQTKSYGKGIVTGTNVYMRSGPGQNYDTLGYFEKGETVTILKETNDWYQVQRPNGKRCWIYGEYCEAQ